MNLKLIEKAVVDALKGPITALKIHTINLKDDANDMTSFFEPLKNKTLRPFKSLTFYSCDISFNREIIPVELHNTIEHLEFSSCNLDGNAVNPLITIIGKLPNLKELVIDHNKFTFEHL